MYLSLSSDNTWIFGPELNNINVEHKWVQQDDATPHFSNKIIQLMRIGIFGLFKEMLMLIGHQNNVLTHSNYFHV